VADTGRGVPAELRERIFYPFFTTKQQGSGVGLATAQKIIASHGGLIELEADDGPGARFRIHLPIGADAGDLAKLMGWQPLQDRSASGGGG
jgi:signal transduction histidine kinase